MSRRTCTNCDRGINSKEHDQCSVCRSNQRRPKEPTEEDLTYPGSWYRKGLILAPTHERCPE